MITKEKSTWIFDVPLLCLLAFALRVVSIIFFPNIHSPDEIFQFFEPAHRIAFGYGILPWEFEEAARSQAIPYFLAGLFRFGGVFSEHPVFLLRTAQIALAGLSLLPVAAAYHFGSRISRAHGLMAGIVLATWYEGIHFSAKPLSEVLSGSILICAVCIFSPVSHNRLKAPLLGFLLGLAAMLRLQFLPLAALIAFYFIYSSRPKARMHMAAGILVAFLFFGALDWLTWGAPFRSYLNYFRLNFAEDRASLYGVSPIYWYLWDRVREWGPFFPLAIALAYLSRKNTKPLLFSATFILFAHSMIPHKEYRFVHSAYAFLLIACAIGSVTFLNQLNRDGAPGSRRWSLGWLALLWVATSASLAVSPSQLRAWRDQSAHFHAAAALYEEHDLCGVLVHENWARIPYVFLHRNIPIYISQPITRYDAKESAPFNAIVASLGDATELEPEFQMTKCFHRSGNDPVCLYKREGACVENALRTPVLKMRRLGT